MVDTSEIKASLQKEMDALVKARDELKLQLSLAKSEAKDEWARLETSFERLQAEIKRIGIDAKEPLKDIGSAALHLIDEIKKGYTKVKSDVKVEASKLSD
jgi:hypothetical protein